MCNIRRTRAILHTLRVGCLPFYPVLDATVHRTEAPSLVSILPFVFHIVSIENLSAREMISKRARKRGLGKQKVQKRGNRRRSCVRRIFSALITTQVGIRTREGILTIKLRIVNRIAVCKMIVRVPCVSTKWSTGARTSMARASKRAKQADPRRF